MKERKNMEEATMQCPRCGSFDVEPSGRAPQPTNGWGCKCNHCGSPFGAVLNDDLPFSYDFSGDS